MGENPYPWYALVFVKETSKTGVTSSKYKYLSNFANLKPERISFAKNIEYITLKSNLPHCNPIKTAAQ